MAGKAKIGNYQQYLLSDVWKCPDAPIDKEYAIQVSQHVGAHYWVQIADSRAFRCKHCGSKREFLLTPNFNNYPDDRRRK